MSANFPWVLLVGLAALAGLILGYVLRGSRHSKQRDGVTDEHAPSPRLLSYEPASRQDKPVHDAVQSLAEQASPGLSGMDDVTAPSIRSFNAHSLPGIAYIGEALEPKLKFDSMGNRPIKLRLDPRHDTLDLSSNRPPVAVPGTWRFDELTSDNGSAIDSHPNTSASGQTLAEPDRALNPSELLQRKLAQHPNDAETLAQLGRLLLEQAKAEHDEFERARMLDLAILQFGEWAIAQPGTAAPQALLGEASYRRVLIGPEVDLPLLEVAQVALREAMRLDMASNQPAAHMLHELLSMNVPSQARSQHVQRLEQALALAKQEHAKPDTDHKSWLQALLRTELGLARYAYRNVTARRLRLRDLYAAHAPSMQTETSPGVLCAWVELLCEAARLHAGDAASSRYGEAEGTLERLRQYDQTGRSYAYSLAALTLGRMHEQPADAELNRIARAEAAVLPHIEHDPRLRLQAAQFAAQLKLVPSVRADAIRQQVLAWAAPLTSSPSLMLPALRVVLTALLASGESNELRVYARCLDLVVDDDDVESLALLAEVAFREQRFIDGCRYCARVWRSSKTLPIALIYDWQHGLDHWASKANRDEDFVSNRSYLRMAQASKGGARVIESAI